MSRFFLAFISVVAAYFFCLSAHAEDHATSPWVTTQQNGYTFQRPQFMTISCGKGSVSISMEDGSVKFTDCTPDESAKAFWEAIRAMYGVGCPR